MEVKGSFEEGRLKKSLSALQNKVVEVVGLSFMLWLLAIPSALTQPPKFCPVPHAPRSNVADFFRLDSDLVYSR